jgi:hypothetical protein
MTNEESRLNHIIKSQQEALHHWREQADLDYVKLQRLYWTLVEARDHIENHGGDPKMLTKIEDALTAIRVPPPKNFK